MTFYLGPHVYMTLHQFLTEFTSCTNNPVKGPGVNVDSTSEPWRTHGALLVYPEKSLGAGWIIKGFSRVGCSVGVEVEVDEGLEVEVEVAVAVEVEVWFWWSGSFI